MSDSKVKSGEPFIREDLLDIVRYIKKKRMFLGIHTNATLLNTKIIKELKAVLSEVDVIQVSIDGSTYEINRKMRMVSKAQHDLILNNCGLLVEKGINVKVNATITNHNVHDMVNIYSLLVDIGVNEISFSSVFLMRNSMHYTFMPEAEEILNAFVKVLIKSEEKGHPIPIVQDPIAVPYGDSNLISIYKSIPDLASFYCPAGISAIEVDEKGNVFPCPFLRNENFLAGNLLKTTLPQLWKKKNTWDIFRNKQTSTDLDCPDCHFSSICKGGCAAQSFELFNNTDCADPRCDLAKNWRYKYV